MHLSHKAYLSLDTNLTTSGIISTGDVITISHNQSSSDIGSTLNISPANVTIST